ncbi:MAG: hypothetical protein R8J85_09845 [Mariprofundales bacterium]
MSDFIELVQSWKVKSDHESLDWGNDIDANEYVVLAEKSCAQIWVNVVLTS